MVDGQVVRMENDGPLILYLGFGLPIIGIFFLILAAAMWFTSKGAVPGIPRDPGAPS
jgi:hypothetical protein